VIQSNDLPFWPQHDHAGDQHLFWDPAGDAVRFWAGVHFASAGGAVLGGAGTVRVILGGAGHWTGAGGVVVGGVGLARFAPGRPAYPPGWGTVAWPSALVAVHARGDGGLVLAGAGRARIRVAPPPPRVPARARGRYVGHGALLVGGTGGGRALDYRREVVAVEDEALLLLV
jgi:hypothetical protein